MPAQFDNRNILVLLHRMQRGDALAFSDIYFAFSKPIYRKILWMVNDVEIAKELLQDLFLKLWENRSNIDLTKSFHAYLYTIAVNLVYDYLRKASRKRVIDAHLLSLAIDHYSHVEEDIISKENISLLNEVIDKLPSQRKRVFLLCKVEGKSYDEVSDLLHISKSTIQDHIVKANISIKDILSKNPEFIPILLISYLLSNTF